MSAQVITYLGMLKLENSPLLSFVSKVASCSSASVKQTQYDQGKKKIVCFTFINLFTDLTHI